jgi:7,8-dihydroneopterin aldolase/epimerase/oxygenase
VYLGENNLNQARNNDKVLLSGIRIRPRLGVEASERNIPQDCEADVVLWENCKAGASADDLGRVIDYTQVLAKVLEIAALREYTLLETLAYSITGGLLQAFPVAKVSVRVRKRPAALAGMLDYVQVEVDESRS